MFSQRLFELTLLPFFQYTVLHTVYAKFSGTSNKLSLIAHLHPIETSVVVRHS